MFGIIILSSVFFSATTLHVCVQPGISNRQPDYYWRDYFGCVPEDAVEGGYSGTVTYIGQMPSKVLHGIYPGNIYPGRKALEAPIGEKVVDDTYVKILCSSDKKKFEWRSTTADDMHLLNDFEFVRGGGQEDEVTYIGRANYSGEVIVGRVFPGKSLFKGLWVYNRSGVQENLLSFELLTLPRYF